jgi:hypothetical protein
MTAPRDLDDLASALLDGLLPADEEARARLDPVVMARVAELAAARDAVAAPTAPDADARERAVSAALAAFDAAEATAPDGAGAVVPAVPPVGRGRAGAPRRARRHRDGGASVSGEADGAGAAWRPAGSGRTRWLTAAAVVLAVIGLGVLARDLGSGGEEDTAASDSREAEAEAAGDVGGANEAGVTDEAADDTATEAAAELSGGIVDLGSVGSPDLLARRAGVALTEQATDDGFGGEAPAAGEDEQSEEADGRHEAAQPAPACPSSSLPDAVLDPTRTVELRARAILGGRPVDVFVIDGDGTRVLVAVDGSCAVVVERPLNG